VHAQVEAGGAVFAGWARQESPAQPADETVRFCEMRHGDRIDHGLALGIAPAKWVGRHGDMILPVDEHLDNLVWAWHHACDMSAGLPLAAQLIARLERRIARFLPHATWNEARVTASPQDLHTAWQLRRNCHYQILNNPTRIFDDKLREAAPDYDRLMRGRQGAAGNPERLYFQYHQQREPTKMPNVLISQPSGEPSLYSAPHTVHGSLLLHDFETAEDLGFMCAIQDYRLNKYDAMGLIIEANPSSNVYITCLENHSEHPIFRWYPPNESWPAPGPSGTASTSGVARSKCWSTPTPPASCRPPCEPNSRCWVKPRSISAIRVPASKPGWSACANSGWTNSIATTYPYLKIGNKNV
jgi:hypothetical protein